MKRKGKFLRSFWDINNTTWAELKKQIEELAKEHNLADDEIEFRKHTEFSYVDGEMIGEDVVVYSIKK